MWKQFLSKLPRNKSSKSKSNDSSRAASSPTRTSSNKAFNDRDGVLQQRNNNNIANLVTSWSNSQKKKIVVCGLWFSPLLLILGLNLFISKLILCCVVFDFTDARKSLDEKELKRATLIELVDFVGSVPPKFTWPAILAICNMCRNNFLGILHLIIGLIQHNVLKRYIFHMLILSCG